MCPALYPRSAWVIGGVTLHPSLPAPRVPLLLCPTTAGSSDMQAQHTASLQAPAAGAATGPVLC
jgi:hypothetical protein